MARSCDMDQLSIELRMHFAEMFKGQPLQDWAKQIGAEVPDDLIVGDLDLDDVNESTYFFCWILKAFIKTDWVPGRPKKTHQGQGRHSRPNHGRKQSRGQGKG